MIGKTIAFWKIKSGLKKKLLTHGGKKRKYSTKIVLECCREEGVNTVFIIYAVAAYSTASDFYAFQKKTGFKELYKYKDLRREMGLEKINVDDDYSNPTGAAPM